MADNAENLSLNFTIDETSEMIGNTSLLDALYSPETSTADVEKLEEIVKETEPPVQEEKKPKGKVVPQANEEDKITGEELIESFLGSGEEEEEEEGEISKKAPVKTPVKEEEEETAESQFAALSKDLFKLGVFQKGEDEEDISITTPEEFLDRFKTESRREATEIIDNFLSQFGEDYKNAFTAIYVKGMDPREYWGVYNNVVNFSELDLSQENNQEKVMRQALADQGFEPDDIDSEIDRLKNYGELESVATRHHKALVKKEAQKLQQKEQEAEREMQQKADIKRQYIQNVQQILQEKVKEKEFDGIPVNVKLANELQDFLLVDKWRTGTGETLTDFDKAILELKKPENHATKVKVALLLKILEKDPKLTTIQRSAVTKRSDQLFSEVVRQAGGKSPQKTNTTSGSAKWTL